MLAALDHLHGPFPGPGKKSGLRRARLLRLASEAREQGGLLSHEDLAFRLLNCGLRTMVRDLNALRRAGVEVPTRGQQTDL
jgi:hypothetical protein